MKHPLIPVALCYTGGIVLARYSPVAPPLWWLFAASLGLALLALCFRSCRGWLLLALALFTGWTNLTARTIILSPYDLRLVVGEHAELVTLRGSLSVTPTQRVYERDHEESWRSLAQVQVSALRRNGNWEPAFGGVAVTVPGILDRKFFAGQNVEVTGVLRPPRGPAAEGLFDYRTYLAWQGMYYQLQSQSADDWQLLADPARPVSRPWGDRFSDWARLTLARGLPVEDESLRLIWAMALGWQTALTNEVSEPFMRSGTMHIFAISGLHIALIAGIVVSVLRVFRVPRGACGVLVIPLIWFYSAATGWQSSAIRSTIMMTIIIAGWSLRRPSALLNSLAVAGFIILLWQPEQLFQASFQLSFFVVLSIALWLPPFEELRQRLLKTDPFLPDKLRPRWRRWLDLPVRLVTTSFATSLAAWLGSLPLIAYYFHLITPVSLLANLVIVPLSSLGLMCHLGSLVCGNWLPWGTELFNHSGWFWMESMVRLSDWFVALPTAYWYVRAPTAVEFVFYYALVFLAVSGRALAPRWWIWSGLGLGVLAVIWIVNWRRENVAMRITVLNGASSLYVDAPGRARALLIDCGNESGAKLIVTPFLRGQGVNRLPNLLLAHSDLRHAGGVGVIAEQFTPAQITTSSTASRSPGYQIATGKIEALPQRWRQVHRGDTLADWSVLHPAAADHFAQGDDNVVVVRRDFEGTRILLLSDLGKLGRRAWLEREKDVRADIVIAGLPTQGEPLDDALLEAIQPRVIVIQDSDYPASRRASRAVRERLAQRHVPVFYTTTSGSLTLRIDRHGWEVRTAEGQPLAP